MKRLAMFFAAVALALLAVISFNQYWEFKDRTERKAVANMIAERRIAAMKKELQAKLDECRRKRETLRRYEGMSEEFASYMYPCGEDDP